jgi:hypothetical protein
MGKSVSDPTSGNLTVSFDLMQLEAPVFVLDPNFPDYSRLDYWPAVTQLTAVDRLVETNGITTGMIDVTFNQPTDYTSGYAIIWTRTNGGEWISHTVLPFGLLDTIKRLSIPGKPGDTIEIKVSTGRPDDRQMPLDLAPVVTTTITAPPPDPSKLLQFINSDISDDKLAQYLLKEISLSQVMDTASPSAVSGVFTSGVDAMLPDIILETARQIVIHAGDIGKQNTQIELLNDRISLKLNSNGHVAGMAIGWDESGDVSETVFVNDTFKIILSNGGAPVQAFTETMVDGVATLGLNGDLIVNGSISALKIATDQLVIGGNIGLGSAQDSGGVVTIINGHVDADYVNAFAIEATSVKAAWVYAGEIDAANITTGQLSADRIDLSGDAIIIGDVSAMTGNASVCPSVTVTVVSGSTPTVIVQGCGVTTANSNYRIFNQYQAPNTSTWTEFGVQYTANLGGVAMQVSVLGKLTLNQPGDWKFRLMNDGDSSKDFIMVTGGKR